MILIVFNVFELIEIDWECFGLNEIARYGLELIGIGCQYRPNPYECPTDNVIVQRYRCHDKETKEWKDCFQRSCCQGYTFIAGRCILAEKDPCSLDLCEQKCSVFFGRVICTCYAGYKFHADNQKNGIRPYCIGTSIKLNRPFNVQSITNKYSF